MNRFGMDSKMMYVNVFRLYICPEGRLVVTAGNVKLEVTPDEAVKLLEYVLLFADQFSIGNVLKRSADSSEIELAREGYNGQHGAP